MPTTTATSRRLAYEAFDRGELDDAARYFEQAERDEPDDPALPYMRGLAHKYARRWAQSLAANLHAQSLRDDDDDDEATLWNAGIAATAIGDWAQARAQWRRAGIRLPEGEGPIEGDFGLTGIRLNPWSAGEVVFARRIDPVRARLVNVPFPESGHRYGDIVLHDGAPTGERLVGEQRVPVFNAMARLQPSSLRTFVAFVRCRRADGMQALEVDGDDGVAHVEDWTQNVRMLCMRCSYGAPHTHASAAETAWQPERDLGIAAVDRAAVDRLLAGWSSRFRGQRVESIAEPAFDPPQPAEGTVWWLSPDDDASAPD